jgi:hypothetical protein
MVIKYLLIFLLCMVKFVVAVPSGFATLDLPFIPFVLFTTSGGISGVLAFSFFSNYIFQAWDFIISSLGFKVIQTKPKRRFTKASRIYTKIIKSYGLIGVALITPTIISIPVGTVLALKLFPDKRKVIFTLSISVLLWSILLSSLLFFFK